jgi:hypothetical protein
MDPEERLSWIAKTVDNGQWHATHIAEDDMGPAITHSTGFWRNFRFPEIVLCGVDMETGFDILEAIHAAARASQLIPRAGVRTDLYLEDGQVEFIAIDETRYEEAMQDAIWYYQHHLAPPERFPALQAVLPQQRSGLFPWDEGYPEALWAIQPLLGRRA